MSVPPEEAYRRSAAAAVAIYELLERDPDAEVPEDLAKRARLYIDLHRIRRVGNDLMLLDGRPVPRG